MSRRQAAIAAVHRIWATEEEPDDGGETDNDEDNQILHVRDVHIEQGSEEDGTSSSSSDDENLEEPVTRCRGQRVYANSRNRRGQDPATSTSTSRPFTDKDGNTWSERAPTERRRGAANIVRQRGGPRRESRQDTIIQTWQLFFTPEILLDILHFSKLKLASLFEDPPELSLTSLKAYLGILYFRAANEDTRIPISDLWSEDYSTFYRSAMSRSMFKLWNRILRFDNFNDRQNRRLTDTYAAFRDVWTAVSDNFSKYFVASSCITVDEQLVSSKCRSPHRVYCPNKPGKYGEMIRWVCDANFNYFLKGDPLTKRPQNAAAAAEHRANNKVETLVMNLAAPFLDQGRNVTGDRFFTSKKLAENLLQRRTTYVGTVMKNKRFLPYELHVEKEKYDSKFLYGGQNSQLTLQSYQVRKKQKVFMLSSMHHDSHTEEEGKRKSDIQLFYNSTKAGVDTVDKMVKQYSVRTLTRRWPMVHLHNLLDVTAVNSHTIWSINAKVSDQAMKHNRRDFLRALALQLAVENMQGRLRRPSGLSSDLLGLLEKYTGLQRQNPARQTAPAARDYCARCRDSGKLQRNCNKSSKLCAICQEAVCGQHSVSQQVCISHNL